jgi:hypothetical protein
MVRRLLTLVALLTASRSAFATCASPSTNSELIELIDAAQLSFAKLDVEVFEQQTARAREVLECLGEPVSRTNAASWHRLQGLALFLGRESTAARRSFAAARAIEPEYTFPSDLVPVGNPILEDYAALDPAQGPFELVVAPKVGSVRLDGSGSPNRSKGRPVIYQYVDGRGAVADTRLLEGEDPLPPPPGGVSEPTDKPEKPEREKGGGPNVPMLVGAGVGALVAGGLYAGSAVTRSSYEKAEDFDSLKSLRSTTNTLAVGSGVVGALAIGAGSASFLLSGRF